MIGKTISHYRILEKLGEGGMGVVYKAEDTTLQRTVALKFLPPELTRDPEAKERFIHEARAASALDHHNICTIHEIDETDEGQTFMVMACYDGESLDEKIDHGPLKIDEAVTVASHIAQGLNKAHKKDIVHRDIKPANILVTEDGVVKILDFGLAKLRGKTKLTKEGTTLGTVAYMSPEQARGEEVDRRSDIWSLGVVLYEMITGQRPFKGDYDQAVMYSIINETPAPVTGLRTGVPLELERIVHKCLQKDPGERYQTTSDLLADFRHFQRVSTSQSIAPEQPVRPLKRTIAGIAVLVIVVTIAAVLLMRQFTPSDRSELPERKMLVVLPFENLGPPEDEYFADGITEEITSRLATLHGIGVISRTSSFHYKGTDKTIRQIGQELNVGYVLEGTVRWQRTADGASTVRVTPQLIRVSDDTHLWTERYDEQLDEIFTVQSNIAEEVVRKLNLTLLEPERQALGEKPTENIDAYQAYLRGLESKEREVYSEENQQLRAEMFLRAVELDSNFVLAWAALSHVYSEFINLGMDRTRERKDMAKAAIDRALALQPESPEAHLALGYYYYYAHRDYEKALQEFAVAGRRLPNNSDVLAATAWIRRRQGRWNEAIKLATQAFDLNPRDSELARELGNLHAATNQPEEAIQFYDRSIALAPDQKAAYVLKMMCYLRGLGDLIQARETLEKMPSPFDAFSSFFWFYLEMMARDYEAAREHLQSIPVEIIENPKIYLPKKMLEGYLYRLQGNSEKADSAFHATLPLLEREATEHPEDARVHSTLGNVYALLGRKEEAIQEGELAVELYPISLDAMHGPAHVEDLAAIYMIVGEYDNAIDQIQYLLSIPSSLTVHLLRIDPKWDPLRDNPRFQKLMKK